MKKAPSSTLVDETYTFKSVDLIQFLHHTWLHGYLRGLYGCEDDDDPLPIDKGGQKTIDWVLKQNDILKNLNRRKDGTVYQVLKKPNATVLPIDKVLDTKEIPEKDHEA